jgi:nucleoside-diphosphate-sugar epimerase
MKKDKVAKINGSGEQLRQYIHVTDAISELITATVSDESMRQVSGKAMTVLEVAEFFDLKTEHVPPVQYDPMLGY